jgi:hypothetical protein
MDKKKSGSEINIPYLQHRETLHVNHSTARHNKKNTQNKLVRYLFHPH